MLTAGGADGGGGVLHRGTARYCGFYGPFSENLNRACGTIFAAGARINHAGQWRGAMGGGNSMANVQHDNDGWVTHHVSGGKMVLYLLAGICCVPAGLYFLTLGAGKATFAGIVFIIIGPILALKTLRLMLGGNIAFRYNADGIQIPGLLGTKRLRWSDIQKVSILTQSTYVLGFIKTSSTQSICLHRSFFSKAYVPTDWAGLTNTQMHELAGIFEMLRSGQRFSGEGRSSAPQSFAPSSDEPKNEYADAVVARYLARQKEASQSSAANTYPTQGAMAHGRSGTTFGKRSNLI
jgi:hypothetical protein